MCAKAFRNYLGGLLFGWIKSCKITRGLSVSVVLVHLSTIVWPWLCRPVKNCLVTKSSGQSTWTAVIKWKMVIAGRNEPSSSCGKKALNHEVFLVALSHTWKEVVDNVMETPWKSTAQIILNCPCRKAHVCDFLRLTGNIADGLAMVAGTTADRYCKAPQAVVCERYCYSCKEWFSEATQKLSSKLQWFIDLVGECVELAVARHSAWLW